VIQGTALEVMYRAGEYVPMTEESAAEATLAVMQALPEEIVIHRMTSDPHREELVAPLWMLDRRGVRIRLNALMEKTDFRQGARYAEVSSVEKGHRYGCVNVNVESDCAQHAQGVIGSCQSQKDIEANHID